MTSPTTAPPETPGVWFRAVSKTFTDGTKALDPTDLHVSAGEMVGIVGPSGCGKSTLLRLAADLETPTTGSVRTAGGVVGYVFQDPTLLPWRTVQKNVELLMQLHGFDRAERRERARAAIELTGLTGFERHRPRALSGGMRMRVSLARALTLEPSIFLFDEPFAALDEFTRQRLNNELLSLFEQKAFAGIFVTHSVTEAVFLSSRVLVMSARPGRIIAEVEVPFTGGRSPDLRFSPKFGEVAAAISAHLVEASG